MHSQTDVTLDDLVLKRVAVARGGYVDIVCGEFIERNAQRALSLETFNRRDVYAAIRRLSDAGALRDERIPASRRGESDVMRLSVIS